MHSQFSFASSKLAMLRPFQWALVVALLCVGSPFRIPLVRSQLKALRAKVERGMHLERLVERKKAEVDNLLRRHQAADDPLVMRLSYAASECKYVCLAQRLGGFPFDLCSHLHGCLRAKEAHRECCLADST